MNNANPRGAKSASGKRIEAAEADYKAAAKALTQAIRRAYPAGTLVDVQIGNAVIVAEIIRHSDFYRDPQKMTGINIHTGKTRNFYPFQIIGN